MVYLCSAGLLYSVIHFKTIDSEIPALLESTQGTMYEKN